jgi:hypothetical protein
VYSASDLDEGSSLAFVELAHKTLSRSNIANLRVNQIDATCHLHGQECILSNSDTRQSRLSKATVVLPSDFLENDIL